MDDNQKSLVADAARRYLGTPYHHQGRKLGVGIDCLGLVAMVYTELGLTVNDRTDYSRYPRGQELLAGLSKQLVQVPVADAETGDIFVMAQKTQENHVLMYIKETDTVIHSYYLKHGVVEQPRTVYENLITKAFRHE